MAGFQYGLTTTGLLVALIASVLYSRIDALWTFYANAPGRLQTLNTFRGTEIKFANVVRNCEDVYMNDAEGWAILSCDPGRSQWNTVMGVFVEPSAPPETGLYLYHYADADATPQKLKLLDFKTDAREFHPLGIEYVPSSKTLFAVNHAFSGSRIDIFKLYLEDSAATHIGTLIHPKLLHAPNSIAAVSDTELFVSNDHYMLIKNNPLLARAETYLGIPGGSVVHIQLTPKYAISSIRSVTRVSFANGIALYNDSTLAVSSTAGLRVELYGLSRTQGGGEVDVRHASTIPLKFLPDNLSVDANGKLLITGHPHAPSVEKLAVWTGYCSEPGREAEEACQLARLSWISEWSHQNGLKDLYVSEEFAASVTAVRDVKRKMGLSVGLYEKGVLKWTE